MPILSKKEGKPVLRGRFLQLVFLYLLVLAQVDAQNTTLVYEPDVEVDAAGPVRYLEEQVDGKLTKRADFSAPGVCTDFMQRRNPDGSFQRLVWFYKGDLSTGNYLIEEQKSRPNGEWATVGLLDYSGGELMRARFYEEGDLVEERQYEYDDGGVAKEVTTRASENQPTVLIFKRPESDTLEAYVRKPDGTDTIVARLRYDEAGRIVSEERFMKGKFQSRDDFGYNEAGKLHDHIRYDNRNVPVRHVMYGYTDDGLPKSVVHLDEKDRVVFGMSYTREFSGESSRTVIKNSSGEITGSIEYKRENGKAVSRAETFLLGDGELKILYTDFDDYGNWLRKETLTYDGGVLKSRSETTRKIRYFE